jgi:hypothetical protein
MANIDGQWDCVAKSPMGEQKSVLTIVSKADGSFAGTNSGAMGAADVEDGRVDGDRISFKMQIKLPFPMTMTCEATLSGDSMEGAIDTGAFGKFPITAVRKG